MLCEISSLPKALAISNGPVLGMCFAVTAVSFFSHDINGHSLNEDQPMSAMFDVSFAATVVQPFF
ncbi:MAG: hypothetical protein FD149_1150 [Rhodospirillaceae bacterium]|nr:MAG: hypothetical protein FD149_1150 [Rhodospirillaceae bacterium]